MGKRALIVGIRDYGGLADNLPGTEVEAERWRELLQLPVYGFARADIQVMINARADDVKNELIKFLLAGAGGDDQLLFCFGGHGSVVRTRDLDAELGRFEEALICRPTSATLDDALIRASEFAEIIKAVPPGADLTTVIDVCFAARFEPAPPKRFNAKRLSASPPREYKGDALIWGFGELANKDLLQYERPVIVAAAGRQQAAYHLDIDGKPRLLFSWRATEYLNLEARQHRRVPYDVLIERIKPLMDGVPQVPELRGNRGRFGELFPGQATVSSGASIASDVSGSRQRGGRRESASVFEGGIVSSIDVCFIGICCFAKALRDDDRFKRLVLLPVDDVTYQHIPFIEIADDDIDDRIGAPPDLRQPHTGSGLEYHRWILKGHFVTFENADPDETFEQTSSYSRHVPAMQRNVCRSLNFYPRTECFADDPGASLLAGVVRIPSGELTANVFEGVPTIFRTNAGEISPFGPERTPVYVSMTLPLTSPKAIVRLTPFASSSGDGAEILLKPGATIMIGNAREEDISGDGSGVHPPHDYLLYYKLSDGDHYPDDPPLPYLSGVPVNSCSVTDWP